MLARVPVPWGSDARGTKQTVSGRSRNIRWEVPEPEESEPRERQLVSKSAVAAFNAGQTITGRIQGTHWVQEGSQPHIPNEDFDVLTAKADIPTVFKAPPQALIKPKKVPPQPSPLKWAVQRLMKGVKLPPSLAKLKVTAVTPATQRGIAEIPPSVLAWATRRGIKRVPPPEKLIHLDPFTTTPKITAVYPETQEWVDQLPPSLLAWATERGIKKLPAEQLAKLDPFKTKTKVVALEDRRATVMMALKRGEWCLVEELEVFPPRLKRWLIQCKVRFIRWEGRFSSSGGKGPPFNGYVTETGQVFYVAEDGATFYVQES